MIEIVSSSIIREIKRLDKNNNVRRYYVLLCSCGKEYERRIDATTERSVCQECTNKLNTQMRIKHGMHKSAEYSSWESMKSRCNNKRNKYYYNYGGRGISVCEEWREFKNFFADMGARPSNKHSIDRINNEGNYEKSNCKWSTREQQMRNTRRNINLSYNGQTYCLAVLANLHGLTPNQLYCRLYRRKNKMSLRDALTLPIRKKCA